MNFNEFHWFRLAFWELYSFPVWNTFNGYLNNLSSGEQRSWPLVIPLEKKRHSWRKMEIQWILRGKVKYCSNWNGNSSSPSSLSCQAANCFDGFHGINLASSVEYRVSSSMVASCSLPCNNLRSSHFYPLTATDVRCGWMNE